MRVTGGAVILLALFFSSCASCALAGPQEFGSITGVVGDACRARIPSSNGLLTLDGFWTGA